MRISILSLLFLFSFASKAQSDTIGMKGYHFYIKSGLPETAVRLLVNNTFHLDGQLQFRLKDAWYLTSYYGFTNYAYSDIGKPTNSVSIAEDIHMEGKALNKSHIGIRFHPYYDHNWTALNYFFLEGGVHYQQYIQNQYEQTYFISTSEIINDTHHRLNVHRYGPYINIGFSRFFADYLEKMYDRRGPKITFTPELSLGFNYNFYSITEDTLTIYAGEGAEEAYFQRPFRLVLNASVGIGLFK